MSTWFEETYENKTRFSVRVTKTLFSGQSDFQRVEVFDTEAYGPTLAIDGNFMTSEHDEFFYHEMIVHPALTTVAHLENVLIIGGGDGGTAREVLRHDVKRVVMAEIDGMVVEASKKFLPTISKSFGDPRLDLRIIDGIAYVKETSDRYDVVLLDGTDPVGPAEGLFNKSFYEGVRRILRPGGVFALQSESPTLMQKVFVEVQHTLGQVFPKVHPYFGTVPIYPSGTWSWTYATDTADPTAINEKRLARIEEGCRLYNRDIHRGAFAVPNYVKRALGR